MVLRTKVIGTMDQLRYVNVARATWHWRHAVVAGRKSRAGEYTGNHVTARVVAAADAAAVRSPTGTDQTVTADQLDIDIITMQWPPPAAAAALRAAF